MKKHFVPVRTLEPFFPGDTRLAGVAAEAAVAAGSESKRLAALSANAAEAAAPAAAAAAAAAAAHAARVSATAAAEATRLASVQRPTAPALAPEAEHARALGSHGAAAALPQEEERQPASATGPAAAAACAGAGAAASAAAAGADFGGRFAEHTATAQLAIMRAKEETAAAVRQLQQTRFDMDQAMVRFYALTPYANFMTETYPNGTEDVLYYAEGPAIFGELVDKLYFGDSVNYFAVFLKGSNRQNGTVHWLDSMGDVGMTAHNIIAALVKTGGTLIDNVYADELNTRSPADIDGVLARGGALEHALHAGIELTPKVCDLLGMDPSPPEFMVLGQSKFRITYKAYLEAILTISGGLTRKPTDLGAHIDGWLTGTILNLLSGVKILLLARPTIENLILFGKHKSASMLEVPYSDKIALLLTPGDVVAFPACAPHQVINMTQDSCMTARTCQTPGISEPVVQEMVAFLRNTRKATPDRKALSYCVQVLCNMSSAEGDADNVLPEIAAEQLEDLWQSHLAAELP